MSKMEKRMISPMPVSTTRLVKSEDLNHHGTLFAGRTAEWFVEAGFISAASLLSPQRVVCLKIHGLHFTMPVRPGEIIRFDAKIVYTGRTSLISYIKMLKVDGTTVVTGFITFIHVDENTHPSEHGIVIVPDTDEDKALYEQAKDLKK